MRPQVSSYIHHSRVYSYTCPRHVLPPNKKSFALLIFLFLATGLHARAVHCLGDYALTPDKKACEETMARCDEALRKGQDVVDRVTRLVDELYNR